MKINFNSNQNFYGRIVYNKATNKMKWVLNSVSAGPKNLDLFGALEYSIKQMMPSDSDKFMFTEVEETDKPNSFLWKAKFIHKGKDKPISASEPYNAVNNDFHEMDVMSILLDLIDVADEMYQRDKINKPKFILPNWSNFRKN